MKKVQEILKPYLSVVLGALLLLCYLNWLSYQDGYLAVGIIAVIIAVYYLASGVLWVILGEKLPKPLKLAFDIASISLFPLLMFTYFIVLVVTVSQNEGMNMGPTGWVIVILMLASSIGLIGLYITSKFVKAKLVARLASLFALAFILSLLLDILFAYNGDPNVLGNISLVTVGIYTLYSLIVVDSLRKEKAAE